MLTLVYVQCKLVTKEAVGCLATEREWCRDTKDGWSSHSYFIFPIWYICYPILKML